MFIMYPLKELTKVTLKVHSGCYVQFKSFMLELFSDYVIVEMSNVFIIVTIFPR